MGFRGRTAQWSHRAHWGALWGVGAVGWALAARQHMNVGTTHALNHGLSLEPCSGFRCIRIYTHKCQAGAWFAGGHLAKRRRHCLDPRHRRAAPRFGRGSSEIQLSTKYDRRLAATSALGCLRNSAKYKILSALSCNFCSLLASLHKAPQNRVSADPLSFGTLAQGPC